MLAQATDQPVEALEPLRATIFARSSPLIAGTAAVIDDHGQILLNWKRTRKWEFLRICDN